MIVADLELILLQILSFLSYFLLVLTDEIAQVSFQAY